MSNDERPDSLAAQAAAWVPPWERARAEADRTYQAAHRAADDPHGLDGADGLDGVGGQEDADGPDDAGGRDGADGLDDAGGRDGAVGLDDAGGRDGADGLDDAGGRDGADGLDDAGAREGADGPDDADGRDSADRLDGAGELDGTDGRNDARGLEGADGLDEAGGRDGSSVGDGALDFGASEADEVAAVEARVEASVRAEQVAAVEDDAARLGADAEREVVRGRASELAALDDQHGGAGRPDDDEGRSDAGLSDDDDDFDTSFEAADPPGYGVSESPAPGAPGETERAVVDEPRELSENGEPEPTELELGDEVPLPDPIEEAAEAGEDEGGAPVDAPLPPDGDDAGDVFDAAADDDVSDDGEVDLPFVEVVPTSDGDEEAALEADEAEFRAGSDFGAPVELGRVGFDGAAGPGEAGLDDEAGRGGAGLSSDGFDDETGPGVAGLDSEAGLGDDDDDGDGDDDGDDGDGEAEAGGAGLGDGPGSGGAGPGDGAEAGGAGLDGGAGLGGAWLGDGSGSGGAGLDDEAAAYVAGAADVSAALSGWHASDGEELPPAEPTARPAAGDGPGVPAQGRRRRGRVDASGGDARRTSEAESSESEAAAEALGSVMPALEDGAELAAALEAIMLVVDEPVAEMQLAQILEQPTERIAAALEDLSARYTAAGHGFDLRRAAGGWRFYTRPEYAAYVERFVLDGQSVRLTQAALETLAVVAYKQPVTRSRISAIRGVNCDGVMRTLATRGLIEECGTEGETGAHLYRTTALFLEKLGLNSVEQLPPLAPFLPDDVEEVLDATG